MWQLLWLSLPFAPLAKKITHCDKWEVKFCNVFVTVVGFFFYGFAEDIQTSVSVSNLSPVQVCFKIYDVFALLNENSSNYSLIQACVLVVFK